MSKMVDNLKKVKKIKVMKNELDEFLWDIMKYLSGENNFVTSHVIIGCDKFFRGYIVKD